MPYNIQAPPYADPFSHIEVLLTTTSQFDAYALREYSCLNVDQNLFIIPYTNEILYEIGKIFGVDLKEKYKTASDLRRLLKY